MRMIMPFWKRQHPDYSIHDIHLADLFQLARAVFLADRRPFSLQVPAKTQELDKGWLQNLACTDGQVSYDVECFTLAIIEVMF